MKYVTTLCKFWNIIELFAVQSKLKTLKWYIAGYSVCKYMYVLLGAVLWD